jgi:hypothetical protein
MMAKKTTRPHIAGLSPLELNRKIPLAEAANINSVSVDTFKRNFFHLLVRVGKRRWAVKLEDALTLPPPRA